MKPQKSTKKASKKLEELKTAWKRNRGIADAMIFLYAQKLSTILATKIYETYNYNCIDIIKSNPYKLARDINGIGFKKADEIALGLGFETNCNERIEASIEYILGSDDSDGHCFLTYEQIKKEVNELLKVDVSDKLQDILIVLENAQFIVETPVVTKLGNEIGYYIKYIYENEK